MSANESCKLVGGDRGRTNQYQSLTSDDTNSSTSSHQKRSRSVSNSAMHGLERRVNEFDLEVTHKRSNSEADLLPTLRFSRLEHKGRRELYEALPFIAAFGMQNREKSLQRIISKKSKMSLSQLDMEHAEIEHSKYVHEVDVDETSMTFPLLMAVIMAMISQFLTGYNTSVMNAPENVIFPGHATYEWALAVSAFAIGGPVGALVGGQLANKYGRKGAMLTNMWIFMIGGLIMTSAPSVLWLIPGRFIIGIASGLSSVVVPVYLGEISPPSLRGTLGTCTQFALVIGILVADLLAFPLAAPELWRALFFMTPLLCTVQLLASTFLIESPRWLLNQDVDSIDARDAIRRLRGYRHDGDVMKEVQHFLHAAARHKTSHSSAHSSGAMFDLIKAPGHRKLVIAAIVLQAVQQLSGINAVFYYSTLFFDGIISNPLVGTSLVAFVNVLATGAALLLMDSMHRRTMLLWSSGGMLASVLVLTAALAGYISSTAALVAVMAYVSFFEIGLGPIPWLIVAEYFDAQYVATAMSVSCIVNWGCNFIVGIGFPHLHLLLQQWTFLPFGLILIFACIFIQTYVTETFGLTVLEVQQNAGVKSSKPSLADGFYARDSVNFAKHLMEGMSHDMENIETFQGMTANIEGVELLLSEQLEARAAPAVHPEGGGAGGGGAEFGEVKGGTGVINL